MNVRKSSPVQSNIRTVTAPTRGPTPPPAQLRGHFEELPHYSSHFQAAAAPFQSAQPAYLDMNKPVPGRVAAPGLGQAPQTFNVPRAQHQPYGQLVADAQDQQSAPMAWNPQGTFYLPTANQNMRQPRMQGMNNGQVPGSNLTFMTNMPQNLSYMPSGMTPAYNGNQGLQFVQNPSGQFMQYSQPRMPFPTTMQQQAQMSFVQPYGAPASAAYPGYFPMQIPNTSRPSSVGPQGAGGAVPKQTRNRKMLSLTDPNTGEDITEKVFKPPTTEEVDQNAQEVQEHRNAVTIEFATKVAMLAGDKKDKEGEVSHNVQLSAPAQSAKVPILPTPSKETDAAAASVIEPVQSVSMEEHPVLNGEPDQTDNIQEDRVVDPPASYSVPASVELETPPQPVETAGAAADVQTPSPALAAAPVMPAVDVEAPVNIVPAKEMTPSPVVESPPPPPPVVPEKEPLPPLEAVPEAEPNLVVALQTTTVSAADAASVLGDSIAGQDGDSKPTPQASGPQPQRQDVRKTKKNRKELNKKSKEGSDMDAFYDTQASPESTEVAEPEQTEAAPTSAAVPEATVSTVSPPATVEATEADDDVVEPPQQVSPAIQVSPDPEPTAPQPQPEAPAPVPPVPPPEVKVEAPPKEEKAATPAENGVGGDAEPVVDKTRPKQMINGVQLNYKEGQWSPANPEGKKQYDREFLLKLQANPESRKPPSLPDMPEIMVDPRMLKIEDFQKAQALAAGRTCPDFTPGFFKSTPRSGGPGSMNKRGSQQGRRGGQGSQGGEQQRIIPSLRQEITLHKSENAYKPMLFQKDVDADDEAKETQQVLRAFKSVLNKLTPEKYKKLSEDVLQLSINTEERLSGVTDLVFEKAIAESKFATQYAFLCRDMLKLPKVPKKDKPNETLTFRAVLLTKCQKEFESDTIVEGDLDRRRKELDKASDQDQKTVLVEELKEATTKARRRSMGNIRFIGELYRLKMLTENIMHDCIFKLLKIRDDDSIECLTKLLETIGKDLDHPKAKQRMDQYFAQFEKMTADMSKEPQERPQSKGKESKDKLCTRVKFSVLEIIDMRKNNWVIRKIHDQNKPSTLGEIHQKAKMEQQEQQFLNSQPRMDSNSQSRGAKGKGRGSMQGDTDGWNTVPAKPVRQQIDAAKMKLTKTSVDEITLTLGGGNKFSSWGRGSQGGGSRSQEQEKSGNRYNALNSLNDSDGRRGYGRSPARGDSRGGGRMGGDRDRRDRDRDFRSKPASRSSMESERERAVASTRNMLGAGAASNPSSRNSSRDNSRSRDMPPSSAPRVPSGPDASQMNAQELERRLTTIAEELHSNQSIKDARESISEISHLDHSVLVMTLLEKLVEKAGKTRKLLGQLLYDMVKERQMSIDDLIKGIAEFLQYAEDLELDIPKIWDNLAEVFASLLQDSKVLPLHFLQACMQPLVNQGNKKEAVLVQKILKMAAEYKSKDAIQAYWAASGLTFSDFGIDERAANFELQWLKGPGRNAVHTGILNLLQNPNCTNEDVMRWVEKNFKKEEVESHQFIRELMSAICKSYFNTKEKRLDAEGLKSRVPLLRKYLDDDKERGTQALFGVQHLLCELEHPQGVVRTLFDLFYDEDIISEESFFEWERRDGSPDDMVGKGVVKMNVKDFFEWLRSNGEEEDRTS